MRYFPQLNIHTGSVNGTIFLLQVMYWYGKMGRPFYKFQNPNSHALYEPGKSWAEELGFNESQLKYVLRNTASKLRSGRAYDLSNCALVLYWNAGNGLNYYCLNYPALLILRDAADFSESRFPHFAKWKSHFPKVEKDLFQVVFSHPQKFDVSVSYIQEITQQNTIKYPGEKIPPFFNSNKNGKNANHKMDRLVLPFESAAFKKIWSAWKDHKLKRHHFTYTFEMEQASLFPLTKYEEDFVVHLIRTAISNDWKSFHFQETPAKYLEFQKNQNNGKYSTKNGERFALHIKEIFEKYSRDNTQDGI